VRASGAVTWATAPIDFADRHPSLRTPLRGAFRHSRSWAQKEPQAVPGLELQDFSGNAKDPQWCRPPLTFCTPEASGSRPIPRAAAHRHSGNCPNDSGPIGEERVN
jgi:hypothetical protein